MRCPTKNRVKKAKKERLKNILAIVKTLDAKLLDLVAKNRQIRRKNPRKGSLLANQEKRKARAKVKERGALTVEVREKTNLRNVVKKLGVKKNPKELPTLQSRNLKFGRKKPFQQMNQKVTQSDRKEAETTVTLEHPKVNGASNLNPKDQELPAHAPDQALVRAQVLALAQALVQDHVQVQGQDPDRNLVRDQGQVLGRDQAVDVLNRAPDPEVVQDQALVVGVPNQDLGLGQNQVQDPDQNQVQDLDPSPNQNQAPDHLLVVEGQVRAQDLDQAQDQSLGRGLNQNRDRDPNRNNCVNYYHNCKIQFFIESLTKLNLCFKF